MLVMKKKRKKMKKEKEMKNKFSSYLNTNCKEHGRYLIRV